MKASASRKQSFIDALARGAPPEIAARSIDVDRATVYRWRASDRSFAERWDDARDRRVELVEGVLFRSAMNGDVTAMIFFLKSHRPDVYNRRQIVSICGDPDAPPIGVAVDERVRFYLPRNFRDGPAPDDPDDEAGTA